MTKSFKGTINLDVRTSTPDWSPYEQPKAPERAPNVLFKTDWHLRSTPCGDGSGWSELYRVASAT